MRLCKHEISRMLNEDSYDEGYEGPFLKKAKASAGIFLKWGWGNHFLGFMECEARPENHQISLKVSRKSKRCQMNAIVL